MNQQQSHTQNQNTGMLNAPWVWLVLVIIAFVGQAYWNIGHVVAGFDEGNYLYKGYNAYMGVYRMYADYGPWYEYMPMAFLVPSLSLTWFGPNFYTGRIASIIYAALICLATYRLTRKLGGSTRAAAIALVLLVGNVSLMRYYTNANPYAFTALAIMVSVLVLASQGRSPWREVLAMLCVTIALVTRRNMLVSWGIILLFALLVQQRHRDRMIVLLASAGFVGLLLWPFYPDVLKVALAMPVLRTFLPADMQNLNEGGSWISWTMGDRLYAIAKDTLIYLPIIGPALFSIAYGSIRWYQQRIPWAKLWEHRLVILTGVLFVLNHLAHIYASQTYQPIALLHHFPYYGPMGAVVGGLGLGALLSAHTFPPFQKAPLRYLLLTSGLVLWIFPTWLLASYVFNLLPEDATFFDATQTVVRTIALPYGSGLLVALAVLVAVLWKGARTHIQRFAWLYALLLMALGAANLLLFLNIANGEEVVTIAKLYWPLAVGLVVVSLITILKPQLAGMVLIVMLAVLPYNRYRLLDESQFPLFERTAQRLAILTTPEDEIFAPQLPHYLLLAQRQTFPGLLNARASLIISSQDDNLVRKYNRYTYSIAEQWLEEADVLFISGNTSKRLGDIYQEHASSGLDVAQLIDEHAREDFVLLTVDQGIPLDIYRRRVPGKTAIDFINEALDRHPNMLNLYLMRGAAFARQNDYQQAIDDFTYVITQEPTQPDGYYERSIAYRRQDNPEAAIADISQAIALAPDDAGLYIQRGAIYRDLGEFDKALDDFTQAIALNPNSAYAYYQRGITYQQQKHLDKAIAEYTQALTVDKYFAMTYYQRGTIYRQQGDLEAAIADLSQAIALAPNTTGAYYHRGIAYQQQKALDKALDDFDELLQLAPDHAQGLYRRGMVYQQQGERDKAIADLTKAIELSPKNGGAYYYRGVVYQQQKELDKALADFDELLQLAPDHAQGLYRRGMVYQQQGERDKAIADLTKAIELKPKNGGFYLQRGIAYHQHNEPDKAIADFNKVLELSKNKKQRQQAEQELEKVRGSRD